MKKAIVFAIALLVAGTSAYALTNSRDGSGEYGPFGDGYANLRAEGDVLLLQFREANAGFGDLIPIYEAALTAAGATVSAIDEPTGGGSYPNPYDPDAYPATFITCSENWFSPNFTPADEAVVGAYLDAGGALYFSGQDYLYGAGYPDGNAFGFPLQIGAGVITQDTPFGADYMDVLGHGILEGGYYYLDSFSIFLANPFYPDTIEPRAGGEVFVEQISPEVHNGGVQYDAGSYRSIFTTIELAGDTLGEFDGLIATSWAWLTEGAVATENTSIGAIKASYK